MNIFNLKPKPKSAKQLFIEAAEADPGALTPEQVLALNDALAASNYTVRVIGSEDLEHVQSILAEQRLHAKTIEGLQQQVNDLTTQLNAALAEVVALRKTPAAVVVPPASANNEESQSKSPELDAYVESIRIHTLNEE
jgi:hypothetical protein